MAAYLTIDGFKALTIAPATYADDIEAREPGWLAAQLDYWSSHINARLRKRYAVPFGAPYPTAVTGWLERLVTLRLYLKRGVDPSDAQFALVTAAAQLANDELKEAADSESGLFDLPVSADVAGSGITKGKPLAYTEVSPYTWARVQRDEAPDDG